MQQTNRYVNTHENDIKKALGTGKSESSSDKDAGFCSGEDTDLDTEFHSPTDTSQDSLDIKDCSEVVCGKNKRKRIEPRKLAESEGPEAKLIKLELSSDRASPCSINSEPVKSFVTYVKEEVNDVKTSPFRPWSAERPVSRDYSPIPSSYVSTYTNHIQEEPLALVVDKKTEGAYLPTIQPDSIFTSIEPQNLSVFENPREVFRISRCNKMKYTSTSSSRQHELNNRYTMSSPSNASCEEKERSSKWSSQHGGAMSLHQRNYKNMTRERRIEANARERTRVHTISAAFETLRKCIPAYANNQKLSKLSVLRIACSYIMTLSRMAGYDYSDDESAPSLANCIESVCNAIQMEGKTRKKKNE